MADTQDGKRKNWLARGGAALANQWPSSWKAATPNLLTLFRLVAGPLVFALLWMKSTNLAWVALVIFGLAAITDFLDGFLSRLWRVESWVGRVMDPIADKLVVASVLVGLIAFGPESLWITALVYVLLMREFLISGMREAGKGEVTLAVSWLGKGKTTFQMIALFVLLAENAAGLALNVGIYILAISAVLSVLSLCQYAWRMYQDQKAKDRERETLEKS